jgi:sugar/nucleoside kinase (ribokinase family)
MPHILGLTNALTDIVVKVTEKEFERLNIKKGSTNGFSKINEAILNKIISRRKKSYQTGGSPGNVIFNSYRLGLKAALMGTVGTDDIGQNYLHELEKTDIFYVINKTKGKSGRVYVLVTPDKERTQITDIGVAAKFDFSTNPVPYDNGIFHLTGYETASNPERVLELLEEFTQDRRTKISFDLACDSMIKQARNPIEKIVQNTDILFATEEEATELTGLKSYKALKELSKTVPIVILKKGKNGSVVKHGKKQHEIPVYPAKVKNTCGAGDAYASGFLYGQIRGFSLEECGRFGSYIASRVCAREESHL